MEVKGEEGWQLEDNLHRTGTRGGTGGHQCPASGAEELGGWYRESAEVVEGA